LAEEEAEAGVVKGWKNLMLSNSSAISTLRRLMLDKGEFEEDRRT
jgi:hypothetical protein